MTVAEADGRIGERAGSLAGFLQGYSCELTTRDRRSMEAAVTMLPAGAEVFIAALPKDEPQAQVAAAVTLKRAGLRPVPHIVARNIASVAALDALLHRLREEAGVDRVLALGGDRDQPAGALDSSLHLLRSGVFAKHGVAHVYLGCYPEGHPRIAEPVLDNAYREKLDAAAELGLSASFVSQFCFDAAPILALAERFRRQGIVAPLRVGVAGPADRATLVKYALMCGIGPSLRALKERHDLARNALLGETPEAILAEIATARAHTPALGLEGVHFFTFGSLANSIRWAANYR